MSDHENWDQIQNDLHNDVDRFISTHVNKPLSQRQFNTVTFINKYNKPQTETDWFYFEYEIGWYIKSNVPKCYTGDHLVGDSPVCKYYCAEK